MEYIDRIFYRKINPSDFKKLYDIDIPATGGGQTYLEAAGINNDDIVDFLAFAEISDSPLDGESRMNYTFNAYVLGENSKAAFIEFAPRKGRANYRICRQNMKYKHPAWSLDNGFPEPNRDSDGKYTSEGNFDGIIDYLIIMIIRTTYKKYYAGYINVESIPDQWPHDIGLETMFEGERRGVLSLDNKSVEFLNSLQQPFGDVEDTPLVEQQEEDKEDKSSELQFKTGLDSPFSRNRIIFGAPGTGKSFRLNEDKDELLKDLSEDERAACFERVTFHPDYSYAQFVGSYKPVMVKSSAVSTQDKDVDYVVNVLTQKDKSAQDKYDVLLEYFQDSGKSAIITRLPTLIGLYTDEKFIANTKTGRGSSTDYSNEKNIGKDLRKYVKLLDGDSEGSGSISYEYVPGPFMRVYVDALRSARAGDYKPHLLIIEEINRANVAAVFGDVFQLLDRGDDNISEYPIQATEDMKKYLAKELNCSLDECSTIRIPDNMFIWATMNSADQGVFPMDTAFKRRWDFKYLGIDASDKDIRGKFVVLGTKKQRIEWNSLRKAINEFLANEKINEDKQLGPYFISKKIVVPSDNGDEIDSEKFCDAFKNKVIMYLFDDAAKQRRGNLFAGSKHGQTRYSKICDAFDEQGIEIFHANIISMYKDLVGNTDSAGSNTNDTEISEE